MKNIVIALIILSATVGTAYTQDLSHDFNAKKGIAIEGYDPVSYFNGNPKKGNHNFKATYHGVIYWFSSDKNLELFKASPEKYEPQYGGWCAYAMGKSGDKVKIDPETYKITNGKLYLFYNFNQNNTLIDWNKNENNLIKNANQYWNKIVN